MSSRNAGLPLRVCHLGKFYPPSMGGVELHVQTLARAQATLGAAVRVLCVNHADEQGRDITWRPIGRNRTIEERDGDVRLTRVGRLGSIARMEITPTVVSALRGLTRENTDIVHLHAPNPAMFVALLASPDSPNLVITHHADVVRQVALNTAFSPVDRLIYGRARMVLATSDAYAPASRLLRRHADKVRTLPLGIDLQPFLRPSARALEAEKRFRALGAGPTWLTVGRLIYYKGLENAVRALRHVPGRLIMVGRGPLESSLKDLARAEGVADRITWAGYLDDEELVGAYRAATALWFPSSARAEAFGLSQVEAMASGCPVINTDIPGSGVPWVSVDGVTGITVPMNDPTALARAARRLHEDPSLRARLADAAVKRAIAEFDHRRMASQSLVLYREILGLRAPSPQVDAEYGG